MRQSPGASSPALRDMGFGVQFGGHMQAAPPLCTIDRTVHAIHPPRASEFVPYYPRTPRKCTPHATTSEALRSSFKRKDASFEIVSSKEIRTSGRAFTHQPSNPLLDQNAIQCRWRDMMTASLLSVSSRKQRRRSTIPPKTSPLSRHCSKAQATMSSRNLGDERHGSLT